MASNLKCPICGGGGFKAILGPLPVKMCEDESCACAWGFWCNLAFWLGDKMQPNDGPQSGWYLLRYDGSYLSALWHVLTSKPE